MLSVTTVIFVLFAGIFFYTGINYLINIRGYRKDYFFILYGLLCMSGAAYAVSSIFAYHSPDLAYNLSAVKFQSISARLILVILPWFIGLYADFIPKRLLAFISISAFLLGIGKVVLPDSILFPNLRGLNYLDTPWGERLTVAICDPSFMHYWLYVVYLVLFIFIIEACRRLIRSGRKSQAWPLLFSLSFGLIAFVNDVLLDANSIRSMNMEEYAIFTFILVVGSWLSAQRMHAEGNYRTLFHAVSDGIFVHDAQTGKVLDANEAAARIFGTTREEIVTGGFARIFTDTPPYTVTDALRWIQQTTAKNPSISEWLSHRLDDGRLFYTEVALRHEIIDGRHVVLAVVRDISERKKSEEQKKAIETQMQQSQKLESLGLMAGSVAHDFNNLLTVILGNTSLAYKGLQADSETRQHLDHISAASQRAASLCRQLLAYSGKGGFVIERFDLKNVVADITRILEVSIPKNIDLILRFDPLLPQILADATQIRQVVMNLVTNAVEAIGDKPGTITLSASARPMDRSALKAYPGDLDLPEGTYVVLEVADTGCGMDKKTASRVFEPFFTTKFTGRGLGMAAVLGIVQGHQGAIRIDSSPGKGAVITVLFPPAPESPKDSLPAPAAVPAPSQKREIILLVDDDAPVLKTLSKLVGILGYKVLTAESGRQALEIFKKQHKSISCVLLDLTMPDMDGGETLLEMRRLDPKTRVVLTSGFSEQEVKTRFKGQDISGFLQKPYTMEDIKAAIESAVDR